MKLTEEVKEKTDEYFNNITAKELYEIAVGKYGLKEKETIMKQNLSVKDKAIKIADFIAIFPTKEEVEKETLSYDNSMSSSSESIWVPVGFKKGVEWVLEKLEEGLGNIELKEKVTMESDFSSLVEEKDLVGDIEGFPIEVVQWLVGEQVRQGNNANASVFQRDIYADKVRGGINWDECPEEEEEDDFCVKVLNYKNFEVLFDKYPKQEEEKSAPPKHETTIYDLDLHESLHLSDSNIEIVRVPGGWIYSHWHPVDDKSTGGVFVKYDKEFQNK